MLVAFLQGHAPLDTQPDLTQTRHSCQCVCVLGWFWTGHEISAGGQGGFRPCGMANLHLPDADSQAAAIQGGAVSEGLFGLFALF